MTHGQCLCGAVRFTVNGPVRDIFVCHCSICRRLHGGPANYSACEMDELHMDSADELRHFDVADATYSFCGVCGSRPGGTSAQPRPPGPRLREGARDGERSIGALPNEPANQRTSD